MPRKSGATQQLDFTFDGKLLGDIGEALAVEYFGIVLDEQGGATGIDGHLPNSKATVQVKATGTGRGANFRPTKKVADYLLFFSLDMERGGFEVVYNGPEDNIRNKLPKGFNENKEQRAVSFEALKKENSNLSDCDRIKLLKS